MNKEYVVVIFVSRHKDNREVEDFAPRSRAFFCEFGDKRIEKEYDLFLNEGLPGEMSRMYVSINKRKNEKVQKDLIHYLIDNDLDLTKIESKVASLAMKPGTALEHKWLFDFDLDSYEEVENFIKDIKNTDSEVGITLAKTPNGFAVITDRGFNSLHLMNKWSENVTLKRDGMLCYHWGRKE